MSLIRNEFDKEINQEIHQIIEHNIEEIKDSSNTKNVYDWKDYLSEETLLSLIDQEVPRNRHSNMSRINLSTVGKKVKLIMQRLYPDMFVWCSGYFYYPPTGFMGWHTNHNDPCDRVYITYASESNKSFFRYYDNGELITDYDDKGITIRRFKVTGERPYFWHCVGSECDRISIGFTFRPITKYLERPMALYAIIENNKVINLTEWNGDTSIWSPPTGTTAVLANDKVAIGCSYIDNAYVFESVSGDSTNTQKFAELRTSRNTKIAESDWRVVVANETGTTISTEWKKYRQALRDLPANTSDINDPPWPTEPS